MQQMMKVTQLRTHQIHLTSKISPLLTLVHDMNVFFLSFSYSDTPAEDLDSLIDANLAQESQDLMNLLCVKCKYVSIT